METVVAKLNQGQTEFQNVDYNSLSDQFLRGNFFAHIEFGINRGLLNLDELITNVTPSTVVSHTVEYLCFVTYLVKKGLDINKYLTLNFGVQIHIAIYIYQYLKRTRLGEPFIGYFFKSLGVHSSLSGYITKSDIQETKPLSDTIQFSTGEDETLFPDLVIKNFINLRSDQDNPVKFTFLEIISLMMGNEVDLTKLFQKSLSSFTSLQIIVLSQSNNIIRTLKDPCLFQNSYVSMQQGIYLAINSQIFENFKLMCEKGSDLNYVVMSELISRYYEAGEGGDEILKKEFGDMISYAIESGAEIDNFQLKYLSLQADAELIVKIKDNYSRPMWEKLCRLRDIDGGSISNKQLRTLAFDLNIDFSLSPARICQKLQEISNMDRVVFFKESVERQKERISELTKDLMPSNERRECDPKTTLVNNPYSYNDARISFYVDETTQELWCFTSDMFESMIKSKANPYTGRPLPEVFVQTLKSQINLLESLKIKNNNRNIEEGLEIAFDKNKEISNDESDIIYSSFISTCLMYGINERDFRTSFLRQTSRWDQIVLFSMFFFINCKDLIDPLLPNLVSVINGRRFDLNFLSEFSSRNFNNGVITGLFIPLINNLKITQIYKTSYITKLNFENSGELYFRTIGYIIMDIFRKISIGRFIDLRLRRYREEKFFEGNITESERKEEILLNLIQ